MLRHGYDVHLHYASFGIRRLMFRLPGGLPCDRRVFEAFRVPDAIGWYPDPKPPGGILEITPEGDANAYDGELWDVAKLLPKLAPVRERLIAGDLRPLYVAWLACCQDESATEPPVPAGLGKLDAACGPWRNSTKSGRIWWPPPRFKPAEPAPAGAGQPIENWIARQTPDDLHCSARLLGDDAGAARVETINRIRRESRTRLADGRARTDAGRIA